MCLYPTEGEKEGNEERKRWKEGLSNRKNGRKEE
jgi:hypothetical protein